MEGKEDAHVDQRDEAGMETKESAHDSVDLPAFTNSFQEPPHSPGSPLDTGSVSITAEHYVDSSSLQADHVQHSSPSRAASASSAFDMDGFPLFGNTFRHWMSSGTASKQGDIDPSVHMSVSQKFSVEAVRLLLSHGKHVLMSLKLQDVGSGSPAPIVRSRQPGIREGTDESCDLPKRYFYVFNCQHARDG